MLLHVCLYEHLILPVTHGVLLPSEAVVRISCNSHACPLGGCRGNPFGCWQSVTQLAGAKDGLFHVVYYRIGASLPDRELVIAGSLVTRLDDKVILQRALLFHNRSSIVLRPVFF